MWVNPLFSRDARRGVAELVAAHSLATLVTATPLQAAHVPLLLEDDSEQMVLTGHIPLADPLAASVRAGERLLCILHGPRAYVSAGWYAAPGLPTYNFTVAHLSGTARPLSSSAELRAHLVELVQHQERHKPPVDHGPWELDAVAQARIDELLPAVLGFRVVVDQAQAKSKLGQNRSVADREGAREHLSRSPQEEDGAVAEHMAAVEHAPEPRKAGH